MLWMLVMYTMCVFYGCYAVTSAVTQLRYYVRDLLTCPCKHTDNSLHQLFNTPILLALQL